MSAHSHKRPFLLCRQQNRRPVVAELGNGRLARSGRLPQAKLAAPAPSGLWLRQRQNGVRCNCCFVRSISRGPLRADRARHVVEQGKRLGRAEGEGLSDTATPWPSPAPRPRRAPGIGSAPGAARCGTGSSACSSGPRCSPTPRRPTGAAQRGTWAAAWRRPSAPFAQRSGSRSSASRFSTSASRSPPGQTRPPFTPLPLSACASPESLVAVGRHGRIRPTAFSECWRRRAPAFCRSRGRSPRVVLEAVGGEVARTATRPGGAGPSTLSFSSQPSL